MKSKLTLASAAVMVVMIIIGILLLTYVIKTPDSGNDVIKVTVENGGEERLSFENLSLLPGESRTLHYRTRKGATDTDITAEAYTLARL